MKSLIFVCIMGLISIFDCKVDDGESENLVCNLYMNPYTSSDYYHNTDDYLSDGAYIMYFHLDGTPEGLSDLVVNSNCVNGVWNICSNMGGVDWLKLSGASPLIGSYDFNYQSKGNDIVHITCSPGVASGPGALNLNFNDGPRILSTVWVFRR